MSSDLLEAWRRLRQSNPDLSSPFFCPEFILAVAEARDGVRIAVIEDNGSIAGFFPFQADREGFGKPVGAPMSDYHGIISSPGFQCEIMDLMRACGLSAWDFDHLVVSQQCLSKFQRRIESSPLIDLTDGFAAYTRERRAAGSMLFNEIARKSRRVEHDAGKLRFVVNDASDDVFRHVLSWKSAQYAQSMWDDILAKPWVLNTLTRIRATDTPAFAGMFSVLYAGDAPIAGHFGMRSETVWHYWFQAYEPEWRRYSPGQILLYKLAEAAPGIGIRVIDLGKGQALYKDRFKNGDAHVAEGSVERGAFLRLGRKVGRNVHKIAKSTLNNTALERPARELIARLRGSPAG